jgi:hypothetical protein
MNINRDIINKRALNLAVFKPRAADYKLNEAADRRADKAYEGDYNVRSEINF